MSELDRLKHDPDVYRVVELQDAFNRKVIHI